MITYTIHATKDGETVTTVRTGPTITVAKARTLMKQGWQVCVIDANGREYGPEKPDQLLSFDLKAVDQVLKVSSGRLTLTGWSFYAAVRRVPV